MVLALRHLSNQHLEKPRRGLTSPASHTRQPAGLGQTTGHRVIHQPQKPPDLADPPTSGTTTFPLEKSGATLKRTSEKVPLRGRQWSVALLGVRSLLWCRNPPGQSAAYGPGWLPVQLKMAPHLKPSRAAARGVTLSTGRKDLPHSMPTNRLDVAVSSAWPLCHGHPAPSAAELLTEAPRPVGPARPDLPQQVPDRFLS